MKRLLPFAIIFSVAAIPLGAFLTSYRATAHSASKPTALRTALHSDSNTQASRVAAEPEVGPGREVVHARGGTQPSVTLEEFGDFQCPPCANLYGLLKQLEDEYGGRLRVIFRQFPLGFHEHALEAALASEAAGLQGRFWEMHDLLFQNAGLWSSAPDVRPIFDAYAEMIGLNVSRFEHDVSNKEVEARITSDKARGTSLGVRGTPTIFLNHRAVPNTSLQADRLRAAIDATIDGRSGGGRYLQRMSDH
jgi:protein-disulfide isomerase